MLLKPLTQEQAEALVESTFDWRAEYNTTSDSSHSHVKSATYDWRVEQQYPKNNAVFAGIMDGELMVGFICLSVTKRHPKTGSIRHVSIFEPYRSGGYGRKTLRLAHEWFLNHQAAYVRFFSDKKSVGFYEKCGHKWLGISKSGLPFTLYPLFSQKTFDQNQELVYNDYTKTLSKMSEALVRAQAGKLASVNFELDSVFAADTFTLDKFGV